MDLDRDRSGPATHLDRPNRAANRLRLYPVLQALAAAALFGASVPAARLLVGQVEPVSLAALLYLGSGSGLLLYHILREARRPAAAVEAGLGRGDIPWLLGAILAGGVAAPILLLSSLRTTPAATASILLNFEAAATMVIAGLVFREAIGRRAWIALMSVTLGSLLLSVNVNGGWGISLGAVGVLAACALWGVDNNLTRSISAKDPVAIGAIKGLGAGLFSLALAVVLRQPWPGAPAILGALLLGNLSYGWSVVLFIFAMRNLGAGRTSALFGTAPFIGALLSLLLFRETPGALFLVAAPAMIVGVVALATEDHTHEHTHVGFEHEHRHRHDDAHHAHRHPDQVGADVVHSHPHVHEPITHSHSHSPDLHHWHPH